MILRGLQEWQQKCVVTIVTVQERLANYTFSKLMNTICVK